MAITDDAKKLIRALSQGGAFGYDLMKRSGLKSHELAAAVEQLPASMLIIKGSQSAEQIGDSFIVISPDARGEALRLA